MITLQSGGVIASRDGAALAGRQVTIKDTGHKVTVPENYTARLMYYVSCCYNVLNGLDIPSSLRDYEHYWRLNSDEEWRLVLTAQVLDPDRLQGVGAFVRWDDVRLLDGSGNEFFEITDTRLAALGSREFVIGGLSVKCVERMVYSNDWLERNYKAPMRVLGNWDGAYVYRSRMISKGKRCEVQ